MSLEREIQEAESIRDSQMGGYFARKNRAGRAWKEIRAKLPENLPLPKGILIARVVVVLSIVLFAVFSVLAVLELRPMRVSAQIQSTWHDQIAKSRFDILATPVEQKTGPTLELVVLDLQVRLDQLIERAESNREFSEVCQAQAGVVRDHLKTASLSDADKQVTIDSLELLQKALRADELELREELNAQSNILTFLLAGALVLCCVTLILMERSNRAKEKVASLRFRATHDPLTRGLNRSAILSLAAKELNRAKRVDHTLSLFLIDMDHFKEINDRYGHPVGDTVIRQTANRLRRNVRVYDAVGRYGGDEFLIVLPDCDFDEAEIIAERLRVAFDIPLDLGKSKKRISICIGGAVYRMGDTDLEELIVRADQSLYKAKDAGRNGWVVTDAPIPTLSEPGVSEVSEVEAEA
ncbi:MAG: diguanylate cyclase (GGDEF)-like protein [Planctomycetota bacterium]|jgi:diguanylate cyclase (GGDEF)-like protein